MRILLLIPMFYVFQIQAHVRLSAESNRVIRELSELYEESEVIKIESVYFQKYPLIKIGRELYLSCIGQVEENFDKSNLPEDVIIVTRIRNIVTLKIPLKNLYVFEEIEGLVYMEVSQKVFPDLKRAVVDARVDSVNKGFNLPQGYTGKNVIIGIQDWGFDYTHPMFYDTSLQDTRILAAWDQFRQSGNPPSGFGYGTEINGASELMSFKSDTACTYYDYATHGSHVAGIAGGGGAGLGYKGVAFDCQFLFSQFYLDAGSSIDAVQWMKNYADNLGKRLVTSMSWGLYHLGPADGTSLLSQAFDAFSEEGIVMVTSNGNNGGVNFHIKKDFIGDTLMSKITFYPYSANPFMWGQSINIWGEVGHEFSTSIEVHSSTALITSSPFFHTSSSPNYTNGILIAGSDSIFYNVTIDSSFPQNNRPFMRFRVKNTNTSLSILLKSTASGGTVHYWNVTELSNGAGNWGQPFVKYIGAGEAGDALYGVGEPACTKKMIAVGAHVSEVKIPPSTVINGSLTSFSSRGPTLDERIKPDLTAPGLNVISSVSSFTTESYTVSASTNFNGRKYDFSAFSGTSMSGPMVAGVAALLLEAHPNLTSEGAKYILQKTARSDDKTGAIPTGGNNDWGSGKLTATKAIAEALKLVPIEPVKTSNRIEVFPNPFTDHLFVNFSNLYSPGEVSIINLTGQEVFSSVVIQEGRYYLNTNSLPPALYIVKVFDGNKFSNYKLIKK